MSRYLDCFTSLADQDATLLAKELERVGIIRNEVVEHLTKLSSQVPNLMKHRYLCSQVYPIAKVSEMNFMRVVEVLLNFPVKLVTTDDHSNTSLLCSEHIPDIVEILANHATKWKFIGTALRFLPEELNYIEDYVGRGLDSPKKGLLLLLQKWVNQESEHSLPATQKSLNCALNSQLVGLGAVSDKVNELFTVSLASKKRTAYQQPRKYVISSLDSSKDRSNVTQCQSMQLVRAKENESVLLEVQNSGVVGVLAYKWKINGENIPFSDPLAGRFFYIETDMYMDDCRYSCCLQKDPSDLSLNHGEYETSVVSLHVSTSLDSIRDELVTMYLDQPEVPKNSWPPISSKKYVNLAVIKQEAIDYTKRCTQFTIRGDLDDILKDKETMPYKELKIFLKSGCSGCVLFIEGRPGSGKTTFAHKIMRDWALSPQDYSRTIRSLFLVSLRVLNRFNKPLELTDILNLFKTAKVSESLIEEREGKGVCFIFDGLDEFAPKDGENSIVFKIIEREYLRKCTVIVASRPVATAHLRSKASKVIEILGFKEDQIYEYFGHYPFSKSAKPAELKRYLSSHPNILHICYLPIHAVMVAFLFDVTGSVPRTETEIYTHFTRFTVMRSVSKGNDLRGKAKDIESLGKGKEFCGICLLAFEKTIHNEQVLDESEVNPVSSDEKGDPSLGLLTVDRTAGLYGYTSVYTFLHLTFQEYLAACHISALSHKKQLELIENHGHESHMLMVWKFFCGLVKFDKSTNDSRFPNLLSKINKDNLFQIQCAYESQQHIACIQMLKKVEYHIDIRGLHHISIPDFTAVGFLTSKSVFPIKLTVDNCNITSGAMNALVIEIKQNVDIVELEMKNSLNKNKLLQEFVHLLQKCTHLKELNISSNNITDLDVDLISTVTKSCKSLERIVVSSNHITSKGIQLLFGSFQSNINFDDIRPQILQPSPEHSMPYAHVSSFAESTSYGRDTPTSRTHSLWSQHRRAYNWSQTQGLSSSRTSSFFHSRVHKRLPLYSRYSNFSTDESFHSQPTRSTAMRPQYAHNQCFDSDLLSALIKWPELISLSFTVSEDSCVIEQLGENWKKQIRNCPLLILCECLQHAPKLQKLVIRVDEISIHPLNHLADFIYKSRRLQVIDLSSNQIEDSTAQTLFNKLYNSNDILELNLKSNELNFSKEIAWIQNFSKLKRLNLAENKIEFDGIEALAQCFTHCPNLQEVDLSDNFVGVAGVNLIAESLRSNCTDIRELHLNTTNISNEGVVALSHYLKDFQSLRCLSLANNEIEETGFQGLAKSFTNCCCLRKVNLSMNRMGGFEIETVCSSLINCSKLKELHLADIKIDLDGIRNLSSHLKNYSSLQGLNLSNNIITEAGASIFASNLKSCSKLIWLDLSGNLINQESALAVVSGVNQCADFKRLDLSRNKIDDKKSLNEKLTNHDVIIIC